MLRLMARGWRVVVVIALTLGLTGCGQYAGDSPEQARTKAEAAMSGTKWRFDHLAKGRDNLTRKAWIAYFVGTPAAQSGFGGAAYSVPCAVYVRGDEATPSADCSH